MVEDFAVGTRVRARGLAWDVVEIVPQGEQTLLRLRCAAGDLTGLDWCVLHPAEPVEPLRATLRPDAPGPLTAWRLHHQAVVLEQILGPEDLLAAAPGRVQIEPYQLVPLLRTLALPRPRLLLADGVGLGKTVEAGLIACELIARRQAHRVLIVSPAGPLLVQWAQEMRQRFGLRFQAITDAAALQRQRRRLELGGNPFDAVALCLTSLDFAKQERVLEELERSAWDLAIIDEAHHCVSAALSAEREDTQRRRLAEVIAQRSDGLLLLTATPHDGFDPHFASLIELLDPSLVDGRGGLVGTAYRRHVVRRLKTDIRDPATGAPRFRTRRVISLRVEVSGPALEPVRQFHRALAALVAPRLRRAAAGREHADALAFVSLLKRSVSTIAACVATLRAVAERYRQADAEEPAAQRERQRALRSYRRRLLRFGVLDPDAENDRSELEADGMAADLRSVAAVELAKVTRTAATVSALEALIRLGQRAEPLDPKLAAIRQEIAAIRAAVPGANVLVYTEYADSQAALLSALRTMDDGEVLAISGADDERERTRIAERCAERDGIVLISTDSLAEGLNLQQRCCNLIHFDLPYNPNRLEQRNGRIDRYGQLHDPQIRYLYLAGTFEERLLLHLIGKYEKARGQLDAMPDTLGVTAPPEAYEAGLVAGFAETQAHLFDDMPSEIHTLDRAAEQADAGAYRNLLHEIDRAFVAFDSSAVRHGWAGLPGLAADPAPPAAAAAASRGWIDLPSFVAAVLAAEGGGRGGRGALRLPADWATGLAGLPGFDAATRTFRFTRDQQRLRDPEDRSLAVLGRAHPLVRRAIGCMQRVSHGPCDPRVSVASSSDTLPAVLLTYSVELRSALRPVLRRVVAVLLRKDGEALEMEAQQWLALAAPAHAITPGEVWRQHFAAWVRRYRPHAERVAQLALRRDCELATAAYRRGSERATQDLHAWLCRRAETLCGPREAVIDDLFGAADQRPAWRWLGQPLERLAAYAADDAAPVARRREAEGVVALYRHRSAEDAARATLAVPALHPIGMLMLVPAG